MLGIHHHVKTAEAALTVSVVVGLVTAYNVRTGTRHARWQRERDAERRETRITVAFEHSGFYVEGKPPVRPRGLPPNGYGLRVLVVNSSETSTVWVRQVLIEQIDGAGGIDTGVGASGPVRLEPGEPLVGDASPSTWDMDVSAGFIVAVRLVPDVWERSKAEHLMVELMGEQVPDATPRRVDVPPAPTSPAS